MNRIVEINAHKNGEYVRLDEGDQQFRATSATVIASGMVAPMTIPTAPTMVTKVPNT